jgi:NADH-quinone oxidoreductase subunit E
VTLEINEKDISQAVAMAIEKYGAAGEALIPILSEINKTFGFIPSAAFTEIQRQMHRPESDLIVHESHLFSLASFYHMLSTKALGRHVVRFCESAPCHVMGSQALLQALKEALALEPGETSADEQWSLIMTSCLGVCGVGPVLLVDEDLYGNVTPEQVPEILARYK